MRVVEIKVRWLCVCHKWTEARASDDRSMLSPFFLNTSSNFCYLLYFSRAWLTLSISKTIQIPAWIPEHTRQNNLKWLFASSMQWHLFYDDCERNAYMDLFFCLFLLFIQFNLMLCYCCVLFLCDALLFEYKECFVVCSRHIDIRNTNQLHERIANSIYLCDYNRIKTEEYKFVRVIPFLDFFLLKSTRRQNYFYSFFLFIAEWISYHR